MPPRSGWRIVAALLPLAVGGLGLYNNFSDWRSAQTFGQHVAAAGVVLYGPIGVLAGVALLAGWRRWRPWLLAFSACCTLVGALAPVVWGGAPPFIGLFGGIGAATLCLAAFWAATMAFPSTPPGEPIP